MKTRKLLAMLMVASIAASFASCGNSSGNDTSTASKEYTSSSSSSVSPFHNSSCVLQPSYGLRARLSRNPGKGHRMRDGWSCAGHNRHCFAACDLLQWECIKTSESG